MLGIGVGAWSVASEEASDCTVEGFEVIGVNVLVEQVLCGLGVFPDGSLILRTLASLLMLLCAFVLDADFHPFFNALGGRPTFPVRITSPQMANKQVPYLRSPSVNRDRSSVRSIT